MRWQRMDAAIALELDDIPQDRGTSAIAAESLNRPWPLTGATAFREITRTPPTKSLAEAGKDTKVKDQFAASATASARASVRYPLGDRPYTARSLTLNEVRAGDIHSFASPKEGRLVRVEGLAHIALALFLEIDANITAFTERPRHLIVGDSSYEMSYWCRLRSGEEQMLMVLSGASRGAQRATRRQHREAEALQEAARAAHLPLHFVHEADLLSQSDRLALAYRILPDVQNATRMINRGLLADEIITLCSRHERLRFSHIASALDSYEPADVQCVVAYLLHTGALVSDATNRLLRNTHLELAP